jgi:tetratricopeptide (TPR) repeat protein
VQLRHLAWRRYNSAVKSAGHSQLGAAGRKKTGRKKTMKLKSVPAPIIIFQLVLFWLSPATAVAQPLASRSTTAASYARRGAAWAAKGEYKRAIADYDLAIATDPNLADNYYNRGLARFYLKDYERARADFTSAGIRRRNWTGLSPKPNSNFEREENNETHSFTAFI